MNIQDITDLVVKKASDTDPLGKAVKFHLGDDLLHIDGTGDSNVVSNEDKDADATVKVSAEDFANLLSGDLNPMTAFMSGKIKVDGDMGVAMKLQKLF